MKTAWCCWQTGNYSLSYFLSNLKVRLCKGYFPHYFHSIPLESLIFYHLWTISCKLTGFKWLVPPAHTCEKCWDNSLGTTPGCELCPTHLGRGWGSPWIQLCRTLRTSSGSGGSTGQLHHPSAVPSLIWGLLISSGSFPSGQKGRVTQWKSQQQGIISFRFYPHFKLQVKNSPRHLWGVYVTRACRSQSSPMFPWLFCHRQRNGLDLAPAQTSEHFVQLPPEEKPQLSPWHLHSPLPLPNSTLERTLKIAGHEGRGVAARLASFPITCFSHVDFLCSFEGKEKNHNTIV